MVFRRTLHKTALRDGSMLCAPRRVPPRSPANTLLFGALQIRSSPIWGLQTLQFVWEFWFLVLHILESRENKCVKIYPLFAKSEGATLAQSLLHMTILHNFHWILGSRENRRAAVMTAGNKTLIFRPSCLISCLLGSEARGVGRVGVRVQSGFLRKTRKEHKL